MALTEQTRDYEILIRVNEDGTFGAQYQSITEVLRDGVVMAATVNSPIPLSVAGDTTGTLLTEKLGSVASSALIANETLTASVATLTSQNEALQAQFISLTADKSTLAEQITALQAQVAELQAQVETLTSAANSGEVETPAA